MPAVACIPVFTVAKMFALGVSLVIQDFAAVCGGFGVHPCRPISDGAAHTMHRHANISLHQPNVQRSGKWRIKPRGLDKSFEVIERTLT